MPFTDTVFFDYPTVQLLTPFAAAFLGLTLNQSAFFAEIVRGGILSVDQGQLEAAAALGLPRRRQAFRIVLPQAMRSILPTGFNEIIGLAKSTSMVYVLALPELFYTVQVIYRRNLEVIPLLMVATVWYLVIMTVLSIAQHYIERYFSKGAVRNPTPLPFQAFFARVSPPLPLPAARHVSRTPCARPASAMLRAFAGSWRRRAHSRHFEELRCAESARRYRARPFRPAASPPSSVRPVPASRRCCAPSTIWSASIAASSPSTAIWSATARRARRSTSSRKRIF